MTTDLSGNYTVPVGTLPSGLYNWRTKDPKYLANSGQVNLTGAPVTNVEMGLLRAGDCDDNNVVNANDFVMFSKAQGDPGYDDRADFTGEHAVNVNDFTLLRTNFNTSGAPGIRPTGP
jgi:hypothetical protein